MATSVKPTNNAYDDNAVGTLTWNNPTNVYYDDTAYATAVYNGGLAQSHYLHCDTFNMAIPAYSTIDGISVKVIHKASYNSGTNYAKDYILRLVKADGSLSADNKADTTNNWPTSDETKTYGGATDKWGESWSVADINSNNFGLVLAAYVRSSSATNRTGYVDYVEITVHYTAGSAPVSSGNFLLFF